MSTRRYVLLLGAALIFTCAWVWRIDPRSLPPTPATIVSPVLVVARDAQDTASSLLQTVLLDGEPVVHLRPGDILRMPVATGRHVIALVCGQPPESDGGHETPVVFRAGETLSFRASMVWKRACILSFEKKLES